MHNTLSVNEIAGMLFNDRDAAWSGAGSKAVAEYLYNLDEESGKSTELDLATVRQNFDEFSSFTEAAEEFGDWSPEEGLDEEQKEEDARKWLLTNAFVIELCNNGVIVIG